MSVNSEDGEAVNMIALEDGTKALVINGEKGI
jgi:hypothetical protein